MNWRSASLVALVSLSPAFALDEPTVTRVFYLQEIDSKEAVTLLRSQVQVRRIAEVRPLGLLIVRDSPEQVDQSERLLRERNAIAKAVEPHPAEPPGSPEGDPETRAFRLQGLDAAAAAVVLRSIYQIGQVTEDPDAAGISATASGSKLDQVEALFVALGVLETTAD